MPRHPINAAASKRTLRRANSGCLYGAQGALWIATHYLGPQRKRHSKQREPCRDAHEIAGVVAKARQKYKATTQSNHSLPVFDNHLQQDFTADRPNQKWVGDITYVWTSAGWLYLAVVMDVYSRLIIGWAMSERMTATLATDALTMALWRRSFPKGVLFHSDRGSQYASKSFQDLLETHALVGSMSKKGDCFDNAAMESFFHSLKVEEIHDQRYATRDQAKQSIFEYIEMYYNRKRRHSFTQGLSPAAFETGLSM